MLTGKIKRDEKAPEGSRAAGDINNPRYSSKHNLAVVEALLETADMLGHSPAQLALAWCMNQPGITSPIFGARTMEQLESNLVATDIEFKTDDLANLSDISAPALIYPYDFHVQVRTIMEQFGLG
jgi:aryl-alcohol dehydrogenase-like predicted oxidoreductase